jgi:hypothetical protein
MTSHSAVKNPAQAGIHFDFALALPDVKQQQDQDGSQLALG